MNSGPLKHGHSRRGSRPGSKAYSSWSCMRTRCNNKRFTQYHRYGGRGIKVCERWDSFENFLADMGEPGPGMSLDRIDPNGDYEPGNCRWATKSEQQRNRADSLSLEFDGREQSLADWADEIGVSRHTLSVRIRSGWSVERALTTSTQPDRMVIEGVVYTLT